MPTAPGSISSIRSAGLLHGAYASGSLEPQRRVARPTRTRRSTRASRARRSSPAARSGPATTCAIRGSDTCRSSTASSRRPGIRSVMAVPLTDEDGRSARCSSRAAGPRRGARPTRACSTTIADQASITIRTTRLIAELDRSRDALARRAGAEQAPARDRRPDHRPARAGRDPPGRRQAGRPAGPGGRRDPRPARSRDRQPPLGARRRPVRGVQPGGTGGPVDLGRRRAPPGRRWPRIASSSPTTTSPRSSRRRRSRPSSTRGPASTR